MPKTIEQTVEDTKRVAEAVSGFEQRLNQVKNELQQWVDKRNQAQLDFDKFQKECEDYKKTRAVDMAKREDEIVYREKELSKISDDLKTKLIQVQLDKAQTNDAKFRFEEAMKNVELAQGKIRVFWAAVNEAYEKVK